MKKLDVLLSQKEIDALERRGVTAAINESIRRYLRNANHHGTAIRFEPLDGRCDYDGVPVQSIRYDPPADIMSRIPDNQFAEQHVRAAIRAYIERPIMHEKPWKPSFTVPPARPRLSIQIEKSALEAAKKQATKENVKLDAILLQVCKQYARQISDESGHVKVLMCKTPARTSTCTDILWRAPEAIYQIAGLDTGMCERFVSEALDRSKLNSAWR
jgi:hypothetical protein